MPWKLAHLLAARLAVKRHTRGAFGQERNDSLSLRDGRDQAASPRLPVQRNKQGSWAFDELWVNYLHRLTIRRERRR